MATTRRRRFVRVAGIAVVVALVTTSLVGGAQASPRTQKGAKPQGEVRIAYAAGIDTLDPHRPALLTSATFLYPIYDRLFQVNKDQVVVPMVAKSSEFSADGSTFDVEMRDDVVFHDGSPVNAAAVKASIERGKTVAGSTVARLLQGVAGVDVVDDYKVRFRLSGAGPELPTILAGNAGAIMNPAVLADPSVNLDRSPPAAAGSGPYVATAFEPSVRAEYEAAPQYWNRTAPHLANLSIEFVPQAASRLSALQAGDFDLVQVTADVYENAKAEADAGRFKMVTTPAASRDLLLNIERVSDPDVRKALALATNRKEVTQLQPCSVNDQPYPEAHWAYNPSIKATYDLAAAKKLVKKAGPVSLEVTFSAGSSYEPVATVLQSQFEKAGIDLQLKPVEQAQAQQAFTRGEVDSLILSIVPSADPTITLDQYFLSNLNIAKGEIRQQIEALQAKADKPGMTQEQRAPIYQQIFKLIMDDHLYVPICRSTQGWASPPDVVGVKDMPGLNLGIPVVTGLSRKG